MNTVSRMLVGGLLAAAIAAPVSAAGVHVEITGSVDYNVIQGGLTGIKSGAPVVMSFDLDSNNYLNSATYPTRGYRINLASFDFNIGGVHLQLDNPQPDDGEAFFVLRDNDPGVDGFFISPGTDWRYPLALHVPGIAPVLELDFSRTFGDGTALHSLDVLDAVGSYAFKNLSAYQWTISRFENPGLEVVYEDITLTALPVPEPATVSLFVLGALVVLRRARRQVAHGRL